jgi:hypothetical protein
MTISTITGLSINTSEVKAYINEVYYTVTKDHEIHPLSSLCLIL